MIFKPHDYQQYAIQFIVDHAEAGLLLDMGLGIPPERRLSP